MSNKEKFLKLVSGENTATQERNDWYIANWEWLQESQRIALIVLERLDEINWTQKMLAEKMNVSPQYVSKIVKGKENLTIETICKLQSVLGIKILNTAIASFDEDNDKTTSNNNISSISTISTLDLLRNTSIDKVNSDMEKIFDRINAINVHFASTEVLFPVLCDVNSIGDRATIIGGLFSHKKVFNSFEINNDLNSTKYQEDCLA